MVKNKNNVLHFQRQKNNFDVFVLITEIGCYSIDGKEGFSHWKVQVTPVPRVGNKPASVRTQPVISPLRGNDKRVPGLSIF